MMRERPTAAVQLFSVPQHNVIYLVFLQDYKESPVSSHRPPVSVSSCPLLRLHTISRSLTAVVKEPKQQLSVYPSAQLVSAFFLKNGTHFL